jgi:hypothetical protein
LFYLLGFLDKDEILHDAVFGASERVMAEPLKALLIDEAGFAGELLFLLLFLLEYFLFDSSEKGAVEFVASIHHFSENGALMKVDFFFFNFVLDLLGDIHPQFLEKCLLSCFI